MDPLDSEAVTRKGKRKTGAAKLKAKKKKAAQNALASHPLPDQDLEMEEEGTRLPAPEGRAHTDCSAERARQENSPERDESETTNEERPYDQPSAAGEDEMMVKFAKILSAANAFVGKTSRVQLQQSRAPAIDMSKVINRPSTYDGVTGRFHEWKNEVQIYLRVMKFPKDQEASVVQTYLKGGALNWWLQKTKQLEKASLKVPETWDEFLPFLDERFEHRNPELAARDKLMGLRQNNLTLHQYLKEFEGCYAYIPTCDEADKIHRFLYGLKPFFRTKFCVDPATHLRWTSFDGLVAYISSYVSDDVSSPDVVVDAATNFQKQLPLNDGGGKSPKPRTGTPGGGGRGKWKSTDRRLHAIYGKLNAGERAVLNQVMKGKVAKKYGSVNKPVSYTNANGESVTRNKNIRSYCHNQQPQLCMGCYQAGHRVAECTNAVAQGNPPGYKAPAARE